MNVTDLLLSPSGAIYSASCVLMILLMMLYMSWRLFLSRRRKAYLSLAVSLVLISAHYLILIVPSAETGSSALFEFVARLLKVVSFILVNMAFYQLYNSTKRRHSLYFWGLMFITFLLSIVHFRIPLVFEGTPEQVRLLQNIGMELFLFMLELLALFYVAPKTGSLGKYRIAILVSLTEQLSYLINRFVLTEPASGLTFLERLAPIVFYAFLFQLLFERIVELLQAIYRSSITDGLTGLYNRRFFVKRTGQYIKHGVPVSIIFGDIDNFKKLNDTQGHQKGDEVLRTVAGIAMEAAEEVGIAGRFGGEEMVILVTEPSVDVHELAEYFRERVEKESGATISLGHSTWMPDLTPDELIRQADEAMYQAKTSGKNKVAAFVPNPDAGKLIQ